MNILQKLSILLPYSQKKKLALLGILLLIGMFFEMLSLGILIPSFSIMLNTNIGAEYPFLNNFLLYIGNPTQAQLVVFGMSILVFIYLVKTFFLVFLSWKQSKFSSELSASLSKEMYLGYLNQPYSFHLQQNSAVLQRNLSECSNLAVVSNTIMLLVLELSIVFGIAFMLIFFEPKGAIIIAIFLGLSGFFYHNLTKKKLIFWGEQRNFHAALTNKHLLQGLGGVKDIILLGRDDHFLNAYNEHITANARIQIKFTTMSLVPRLYFEFLAVVGLAVLVIFMVIEGRSLTLLIPTLGIFVTAAFRIIPSANRIIGSIQNLRYAKPILDLLYDEFIMLRNVKKNPKSDTKFTFQENIILNHLSFSYPGTKSHAVADVSLKIQKGQSIGFIGSSGSGKSTLIDLILGLLDPNDGEILIDGRTIKNNKRGWQNQIGYVPQSIYLTDDTLRRNVAFGVSDEYISEQTLIKALEDAQLTEFVKNLPEGLDTVVGERGVRLSGGQRQRIGIARALYHQPSILVLDEATSALDSATEFGFMEAVNALHGEKTILIVAHRLSTVSQCDWIYNLHNGKVVKEGIPNDILNLKSI
jgi:ABC-type multidrug transport system fused ATPase/permease subunit